MVRVFKNKVAEKSSEVTTVYFSKGESMPTEFGVWAEVDELELDLSDAKHLFRQNGMDYYGRL